MIIATPIVTAKPASYVAAIVSNILTAPVFALAVTIMYYDLSGGEEVAAEPTLLIETR